MKTGDLRKFNITIDIFWEQIFDLIMNKCRLKHTPKDELKLKGIVHVQGLDKFEISAHVLFWGELQ